MDVRCCREILDAVHKFVGWLAGKACVEWTHNEYKVSKSVEKRMVASIT